LEKVILGEEECCVLSHAFDRNKSEVEAMHKALPKSVVRVSADVLTNTVSISFYPHEPVACCFRQVAIAERKRLMSKGFVPDFQCDHSLEVHLTATNSVIDKLPAESNQTRF
jgi:hypothetical protein